MLAKIYFSILTAGGFYVGGLFVPVDKPALHLQSCKAGTVEFYNDGTAKIGADTVSINIYENTIFLP